MNVSVRRLASLDMGEDEFRIRLASDADRMPLAVMFAAAAEERDGSASEPPIDLEA